ncbi:MULTISPECIES: hypothetical protein [unclassified Symbiopectobacterium]|uniref:hypothetical protein n=1 Tax=unclassified Symbiopectobacterium TaxID=2794573 RepID=UPI002226FE35|nr:MULTISPECIES: hypothetical protein [unclassified Symbiopectobacterium]MCW2474443.1 hypothetical protein [Candidatus Symbiopectobacterium sp. NZEC151]MCW2482134.1 hypothetical protein [Candidatus Symbiopectobacterium sp. NZEC135]
MKKIWGSLNFGVAHFLLFYMAVLFVTPQTTQLYPIIVWLGMIILSGQIVHFYWNKTSFNQSVTRFRNNHKKTPRAALLSALLFLVTCISFDISNYTSIVIPNALIFITALSIIYTVVSHIKSIDNKEKTMALRVKLGVKYSWLIVSLISYYLARSLISNSFDIPFDTTLNKLITVVAALFLIFIFYYIIWFVFITILSSITSQAKRIKRNPSFNMTYSMSIFAPLYMIGYISCIALDVQALSILKFGFELAMKYDTRDTFYCNNEYMLLGEHPDTRFMFISEGNYRALIPHDDDFTIYRLTCTNSEPFYYLVKVKDKKDLMLAALEKRAEALSSDMKAIMSSNVR